MKAMVNVMVVKAFAERDTKLMEICQKTYSEEENWKRSVDLGQTISGLNQTGLPTRINKAIDRELMSINPILEQYPIETFDDYQLLSAEEHEEIRQHFLRICALVPLQYKKKQG